MMYKETHETWDVSGFVYGPDRDKQYMKYEMKDVKLLSSFIVDTMKIGQVDILWI